MIYPDNFEQKIEFDAVRLLIRNYCRSDKSVQHVEAICFSDDVEQIRLMLSQTEEFRQLLLEDSHFPAGDLFDLTDELKRLALPGTYIEKDKLFDLKTSLVFINDILVYFGKEHIAKTPHLTAIADRIRIAKAIPVNIIRIIDDKGEIRDSASAKLSEIRKNITAKKHAVDRKMAQIIKTARQSGWVAADSEITIREGRQVIPLTASHKRKIKGFVLDESATGHTVYIEPAEVIEMNNEFRELESAERREIIHILRDFTDFIRPYIPDLSESYEMLGLIDFIHAKARFALLIDAVKPGLAENPVMSWHQAVHPLLFLHLQRSGKQVVPLDISLNNNQRILIISGPNAGGKSVCLKTVALLQYMVQCGLLIPVREDSVAGVFKNLLIDIGDEQSLENDLSTYSSHLLNMKNFVHHANGHSLFFIDEFGAGTEPQFGGALAEVVLDNLNQNGAYGLITTHYSNLKLMAGEGNGIINGAMQFDTDRMESLYRLNIGKPGSSFAFEIARKIGFPEEMITNAGIKTGKAQLDFEHQLQQLELEKKEIERQKEQLRLADEILSEMIDKYEGLKNKLESNRDDILTKARNEALEMIRSSNRLIENTIREIRETQAEKSKTKVLREKIREKEHEIKPVPEKPITRQEKLKTIPTIAEESDVEKTAISEAIKIGDLVRVPEQSMRGEVISVKGDEVVIVFNSVKFRTSVDKVEKDASSDLLESKTQLKKTGYSGIVDDLNDKLATFKLQLDVRGRRGDEALELVRKYVDEAILLNVREFRILHGKGYGILRKIIHDYLRTVREIRQFNDEHIDRGGHGVTVVIIK
jgi:DNA mismatch repair protein MutS2